MVQLMATVFRPPGSVASRSAAPDLDQV